MDEASQNLHARALAQRDAVFGRRVFVRGVVEVSNYCRQNCHYSAMRRDNRDRVIMDEQRVFSAIDQAGCQPSRVSIAEHLRGPIAAILK